MIMILMAVCGEYPAQSQQTHEASYAMFVFLLSNQSNHHNAQPILRLGLIVLVLS
jgi:hypothetical protein